MIREATTADIPRLVEMGHRFVSETSYKEHLKDNPGQMKSFAEQMLGNPNGLILVAENGGKKPVGMLAMFFFPHYFSGESIAGEVFWWVEPEARGRMGFELLKEAEKIARARGAKKIQMIAPNEQVARVYEHLGYRQVETTYQRSL